jgi:hypothetical protein
MEAWLAAEDAKRIRRELRPDTNKINNVDPECVGLVPQYLRELSLETLDCLRQRAADSALSL